MTLNLPQDLKDRLRQEAERQGLPVDTLILNLLDRHLPFKGIQGNLAALRCHSPHPGRRPPASALGSVLPARWAGL